jgi:tetratricopeptide (TPR) repeat protein
MTRCNRFSIPALLAVVALVPETTAAPVAGAGGAALAESYQKQEAGDLAGAIALVAGVADARAQEYFPRLRLAYLQLLAGQHEASAASYRKAAALAPAAVEPLLGEQQALLALERFDDAARISRAVLERDPGSYLGLSRLAWSQYRTGQYQAATDTYRKVLALYPGDVEMRVGLGYGLLQLGRKADALTAFQAALAMVPGHESAAQGAAKCR